MNVEKVTGHLNLSDKPRQLGTTVGLQIKSAGFG
jgi:hypothetical protein